MVKSTETILYTPQKQSKFSRTPENSAKKKLLRGGLTKRLNGLQNQERSAISLWRHQCDSYQKTLSGRKSGILIVKILELHEECAIQVAMCELLAGLQADCPSQGEAPGTSLKVFTKETARHFRGHPKSSYISTLPGRSLLFQVEITLCITLAQIFRFKIVTNNSSENQIMCSGLTTIETDCTHGHKEAKQPSPAQASLKDSLLDAAESQGSATWSGVGVQVVVQRVYCLPCSGAPESTCHGHTCEEVKSRLTLPSFCYILTAPPNQGQIDVIEDDPVTQLYQPPVPRFLREILQTEDPSVRCSFYARVIYQRPQLNSLHLLEQREIWLTVTDVTLQMYDENSSGVPKTMPVCVASSCVLGQEVLDALAGAASASSSGTLSETRKPPLGMASGACPHELIGPVKLDDLDSVTQVNCICIVQGTVVGVDECIAFSWPTCDLYGNERLEQSTEDRSSFFCGDCFHVVTSPLLRRHLQVFLDCPSRPQCTVKVKLLQSSIFSLLRCAVCEDGSYEVKSVLGKEVGLLSCSVQSITTHPTSCIGLEEIELLSADRAPSEHRRLPQDL
ncbi:hypothetical protein MC885_017869 [Smutsia gigantea]|nr:hypothetical protein MC885_017869 [Smutsia gigantea]